MLSQFWGRRRPAAGADLTKVVFSVEKADGREHAHETMWAEPVGKGRFRLRSVPFHVCGASRGDTVLARETAEGRRVEEILERGGHSTYRIFVTDADALQRFWEYWKPLADHGCTFERAAARLFAVDVPPEADLQEVRALLAKGEAARVWEHEEAHVGHGSCPVARGRGE